MIYRNVLFSTFFLFLLLQIGKQMERLMQAIVVIEVGCTHVLRLQDIPIPKPGNNQILVDVLAVAIEPIDEYMKKNDTDYKGPSIPAIPGREIAGLVEDMHDSVTLYKKYDRVFCGVTRGGYAEYAVANVSNCFPLSRNLSFKQGAALYESYFNAHRALITKANLKKGEVVLVHGARGGLGVALIQIAKCYSATVVVSIIDKDVEIGMKKAGADHIVYYNREKYLDTALNQSHNATGFNVIFEFTVTANLKHEKNCLATGGRVVTIDSDEATTVTPEELKQSEGIAINFNLTESNEEDRKSAAKFIAKWANEECINPIIGNEYELDQAIRAHEHITSRVAARGKSVFSYL